MHANHLGIYNYRDGKISPKLDSYIENLNNDVTIIYRYYQYIFSINIICRSCSVHKHVLSCDGYVRRLV